MDRGAWRAIVHGLQRVGHNLMTNTSNTAGAGQIPGQGVKILHASQSKSKT